MYGKPLEKIRNYLVKKSSSLEQLLKCYFCTGFWVGIFFSLVLIGRIPIIENLLLPFASCAFCGLAGFVALYLEDKRH
jgi:hypothetical protein